MTALLAGLHFPARHPYLAVTPEGLAVARDRIARIPWAKQTLKRMTDEADASAAKPLGPLPPKSDERHWRIADTLFSVGLAYAFTGDRKYADWVRDGLIAYADIYPALPMTSGRCKVFSQSSLYEAMWAQDIIRAYDLVASSGALSAEDRRHVEEDLIRPAVGCFLVADYDRDPRASDLHYRCYNFQAWHLGAVGMAGLALGDRRLVQYAVASPYGFRHLVGHDIRDDGLFWERSPGYHHFVISALLPFTEAMLRCGVDLYRLEVPNDRSAHRGCHYVTDTSPAAKSLRMMFQAPFYLAFPDLGYVALGDSDRGPLRPDWHTLAAWNRWRDPHLAWMLRREMGPAARAGFLHYYRYQYRYEDVRLDGRPIGWGRKDPTFRQEGNSIVAADEGTSQSDRYLLNDADLGDFVLEWTMTRLADMGREDRAWLVFQASPRNPRDRKTFGLTGYLPEIGRPCRFRLEVRGEQAQLWRDGKLLAAKPHVYYAAADWRRLLYDVPSLEPSQVAADREATWKDQAVGNAGVFQGGCTLLPATGVAVLREVPGDFTAEPRRSAASLSYGPYGGGHGHPDKLNVVFYAQGRQWAPDFGSMPYETHWKREWSSHTVSHNTLVVDEVSQQPAGEKDSMWPCDSSESPVVGVLERFDPRGKSVAASCRSAYPGLTLRRELRLWRHCLADRFEALPAGPGPSAERQFDYVLHFDGAWQEASVPLGRESGPLGSRCGYQLVEKLRSGTIEKLASVTFAAGEDRLRLWVLPEGRLELRIAQGPTNSPDERKPIVILRQRGPGARFRTLLEPLEGKSLGAEEVLEALR